MRTFARTSSPLLRRTLVYFPSKPKHAPSISATKDRTAYWKGFGDVVKNGQFWFLACAYGLMTGVYSGWGSFLAPNLEKVTDAEHAQKLSAYLGFYATLAGCVGGISASLGSDYLGGKMKLILVSLSAGSTVCYLMFQIAIMHPEWHKAVLYATCIVGGLFLNGTIPLFYEAAVEVYALLKFLLFLCRRCYFFIFLFFYCVFDILWG